jgi:hypothetical protein
MAVVLKRQAEIVIENTAAAHERYVEATKQGRVYLPEIEMRELEQVSKDLVPLLKHVTVKIDRYLVPLLKHVTVKIDLVVMRRIAEP